MTTTALIILAFCQRHDADEGGHGTVSVYGSTVVSILGAKRLLALVRSELARPLNHWHDVLTRLQEVCYRKASLGERAAHSRLGSLELWLWNRSKSIWYLTCTLNSAAVMRLTGPNVKGHL